ncbi:MAG TPA: XkdF-like putative serine protease domain-containing protein [Mycobacterium sp.]
MSEQSKRVVRRGDRWCVEVDGQTKSCYDTRAQAEAADRARYSTEKANAGIPRDAVNYRESSDQVFRCAGCTFFAAATNACSRVAPSDVSPDWVCDLYWMHTALEPDLSEILAERDGDEMAMAMSKSEGPHEFLVKNEVRRFTLGVVYEPDATDAHDHFAVDETIERSAWEFMASDPEAGLMHLRDATGAAIGVVVENYIYRGPRWRIAGADGVVRTVRQGSWLLGVRWSPDVWKNIESGDLTGLSLQGRALMREVDDDDAPRRQMGGVGVN